MSWFSLERRDPCFGLCVASVVCVGLIMEIALYCRSGPRGAEGAPWSGATQKSGGAERSGERVLQKNDGAGCRGTGTERGAEVIGLGWSVERLFRPLRSHALL